MRHWFAPAGLSRCRPVRSVRINFGTQFVASQGGRAQDVMSILSEEQPSTVVLAGSVKCRLFFHKHSRKMANFRRGVQRYAVAWRTLRLVENAFWFALVAGVLVLFVLSFPAFRSADKVFAPCLFMVLAGLNWVATSFRCPRCGKKFYKPNFLALNITTKVCIHCGLPKWADDPSAKTKN